MAEEAAEVKNIIIPSARFPLRSPKGGCASPAEGLACAKFEQARPPAHALGKVYLEQEPTHALGTRKRAHRQGERPACP